MSHVTEKLAEFMFEELPAPEMAEARRHLTECANCREQVDRFQQTLAMLKAAPDVEPPRSIVFEIEKPAASRLWRWFPAAATIAALLLMTIALAGRVRVEWRDSQLTVAFGQNNAAPQPDRSAALVADIQRLQGHLAYLQERQQQVERDTMANASTIQLLARGQRPAGD